MEKAWDFATGTSKVVVAVIDTGADIWHPDFNDIIWSNPYEIADNGIDDDSNGYVDDVNGWNFIENNNNVRPDVFESSDDKEAIRHGTLVAGLVGERGNNGKDGTGVNWQASIMPLRAINSQGSGSLTDVAKAVDYATANGAVVISLSFVGDTDDAVLEQSLRNARDNGVVIVSAAGNSGAMVGKANKVFPACSDQDDKENWIIGVGSISLSSKLSSFSNYGDCVDLYAPGEGIFGAERYAPQFGYAQEFGGPWKGTSFSTPIVAGAAALLKSIHPEWKSDKISQVLFDTATDFYLDDSRTKIGKIVNVGAAVELATKEEKKEPNFDYFYYYNKNKIYRRDRALRERGLVANLSDAKIIDLASQVSFSGKTDLAVLFKRGKYYFVRFYKDNGIWWQEFVISSEKIGSSVALPQKISWIDNGVKITSVFKKKSATISYNKLGTRLGKVVNLPVK